MAKDDKIMHSYQELHAKIAEMEKKGMYPSIVGLDYDSTLVNSSDIEVKHLRERYPEKYSGIVAVNREDTDAWQKYEKKKSDIFHSMGKPESFRAALNHTIFFVLTNSGSGSYGFDDDSKAWAPRVLAENTAPEDRPMTFCLAPASSTESVALTDNIFKALFSELTEPGVDHKAPDVSKTNTGRAYANHVVVAGETTELIIDDSTKKEFLEYFAQNHPELSEKLKEWKNGKKPDETDRRNSIYELQEIFSTYLKENRVKATLKISGGHGDMTVRVPVAEVSSASAKPLVWFQMFYRLKVYPERLHNEDINFPQGRPIPNECFQFRDDERAQCKAVTESTGIHSELAVSYDVAGKTIESVNKLLPSLQEFQRSPSVKSSFMLLSELEYFVARTNPEEIKASGVYDTLISMRETLDPIYQEVTGKHPRDVDTQSKRKDGLTFKYSEFAQKYAAGVEERYPSLSQDLQQKAGLEELENRLHKYESLVESRLYHFIDNAITFNPIPKQREIDTLLRGDEGIDFPGLYASKSKAYSKMGEGLEELRKATDQAMQEPDITKRAPQLYALCEKTGELFKQVKKEYSKQYKKTDVDKALQQSRTRTDRVHISEQIENQFVQAEALFRLASVLGVNFSVTDRLCTIPGGKTVNKQEKTLLSTLKANGTRFRAIGQSYLSTQALKDIVLKPFSKEILFPLSNAIMQKMGQKAFDQFIEAIGKGNKELTDELFNKALHACGIAQSQEKGKEEGRHSPSSLSSSSSSSPELSSKGKEEEKEEAKPGSHVERVQISRGRAGGIGRGLASGKLPPAPSGPSSGSSLG